MCPEIETSLILSSFQPMSTQTPLVKINYLLDLLKLGLQGWCECGFVWVQVITHTHCQSGGNQRVLLSRCVDSPQAQARAGHHCPGRGWPWQVWHVHLHLTVWRLSGLGRVLTRPAETKSQMFPQDETGGDSRAVAALMLVHSPRHHRVPDLPLFQDQESKLGEFTKQKELGTESKLCSSL